MKINKQKFLIILLSSTLSITCLGCEKDIKPTKAVESDTPLEENVELEENTKAQQNKTDENTKTQQDKVEEKVENAIEETYNEEDVIDYFKTLENDIYNELKKEDGIFDTVKEKCAYFVLFMSNEKEIKGYTWSELTEETKEKIITIFLNVDSKMCEKYPNYMEKIKTYSKKASVFVTDTYSYLKEKTNDIIDEKIDEETQSEISDSFEDGYNDLKESVNESLEFIKKWARSNS